MNLKDLKNSNVLVSIFIDNLDKKEILEETLFSVSKQTSPIDLLVVHQLEDSDLEELKTMLDSPKITIRQTVDGKLEEQITVSDGKINYILQKVEFDEFPKLFNNVFNKALENGYELCSIIEKFDIVGLNWFSLVNVYQAENPDVHIFFPIIRNSLNGVFSNLMNEASWAEGLAEEAGKIDLNLLNRFNCMVPLGAAFRVKSLEEFSEEGKNGQFLPIKESIKLSHYYEFFMRMIYNDLKALCIPRIGYEYRVTTNDFFKQYSCKVPTNLTEIKAENGGFAPQEAQFWMELAKKEYFFDEDRDKIYVAPVEIEAPMQAQEPTQDEQG